MKNNLFNNFNLEINSPRTIKSFNQFVKKIIFIMFKEIIKQIGGDMKKFFFLIALLSISVLSYAQVRLATYYNYPTVPGSHQDSVLNGLRSIRGSWFDSDLDGDGKSEILVTNYSDLGHVHVFEVVGNDSIELVWTSPTVTSGGGSSTPRYVRTGDLDNDGKKEIIFQSASNGIFIFEWDGVVGSNNFGTIPSQVINTTTLPEMTGVSGFCEFMDIDDIDGDGQNELVVAYNSTPNSNDKYYVISAIGDWSTDDPGFSGFTAEWVGTRTELGNYGLSGGSPYAMIIAQLDGVGNKEVVLHAWNFKNVTILRSPSANNYLLCDTTNGKQNYYLSGNFDDVALFGGVAFDVDNDGKQEVYLPTYWDVGSPFKGMLHVISYDQGSVNEIDSSNVFTLDYNSVLDSLDSFGAGYGDIDGNGKPNIYTSSIYGYNIVSAEFQGGDKRNPANWVYSKIYTGEPTILTAFTLKDSLGVIDTLSKTIDKSFVSKFYARYTDFDKDGYEDIILPYQALSDSITVTKFTWNSSTNSYDSTQYKVVNPKRWGLRVIEGTVQTGVETKEITIITPDDYQLFQNYPNPFNPSTEISFYLPLEKKISLKIYNQLGQEVRTLINDQVYPKGKYSITWDGKNNYGKMVSSGMYIAQLRFGNFTKEIKMMMMK